ncbi:MAG: bifunctional serine/threonine-protein kinase/formylglycine-generating enzyme family protein [Planctomycetota bacterium]|jgi:serine/threonine protein kinase/dienelactone hydrolase
MSTVQNDEKLIFEAASELRTRAEQAAYVEKVCAADPALKERVLALLEADKDNGDFLEAVLDTSSVSLDDLDLKEEPGTVIDRYKLLERIGEGGMAVVYMAEQQEPIRRKVAIKIIKLGMDTKSVIARFEAERQALAMMDHPNIAKVFDAGATETGRPYFVMELVHGISITDYCDSNKLDTRRRLELLVQVCHAVQHAHQKGIIHRDIKPSNVMVTIHDDKAVPKVIDFGIAKATNQRLTEKTLFTRYAHMIGTPAYMSPEQAQMSGLNVDTRTDIYSLGVLLYELLTGTTPFDTQTLREAGYAEIERIIRETDPPKPSTRLRSLGQEVVNVARTRQASSEALRKLVKGDLDWIVMKCLEKDRTRRYETAHGLAEDIERHLKHEPILARSPGMIYRLHKFTCRHRSRIAVAAVVIVLLAGLVLTAVMYRRAANLQWAKGEALPRIVELVKEADYRAAFPLAQKAMKHIPQDPTLTELWPRISRNYSIKTTPAGAKIWFREYSAIDEPWQYLGECPLENITLARDAYRWKIEKEGFATHECVTENSFDVRLREEGHLSDMVWIGSFKINSPSDQAITVEALSYLIDKYEVTNEQFKQFVDNGGYENRDYWKEIQFLKEGSKLSWGEAISEFVDKTGHPGPATWEGGAYPEGQGRHPVSGVSWFEAVAYARFAGKSLPTLHHWEHAACFWDSSVIVPYSNFAMSGTAPVGSHPGMGHTGLYDMAGNAKEWCWNATDDSGGHRYILGGGWGEQTYMFTQRDFRPPWNRAADNGFRCVLYPGSEEPATNVLHSPIERRPVWDYSTSVPCSDEEFRVMLEHFEYDQTPLKPVVERIDDRSPFWRRKEKITFDAAYDNERVIAYLFVPTSVEPPYQAVIYWPGSSATESKSFKDLPERHSTELILTCGRALLFPVYKGTYERSVDNLPSIHASPLAFRDMFIRGVKDLRRSVDYLKTRNDIDREKIAYCGMSAGATLAIPVLAVEDRFKAAVLVVGGFPPSDFMERIPTLDPVSYASRIRMPVLMINGKEDFVFPYVTSQLPMYEFLGTPEAHKKHQVYPGGHGLLGLFRKQIRDDMLDWLDRYLGPVESR